MGPIQWGTAADWAMVIGTVGAFVAAILLLFTQRKELAMVREDSDRRLAARVVVWVQSIGVAQVRNPDTQEVVGGVATIRLVLHNGGEEPVYDLNGRLSLPGYTPEDFHKVMLPPDGKDRTPSVSMQTDNPEIAQTLWYPNAVSVDIHWRDAADRQWHRGTDGRLERISD